MAKKEVRIGMLTPSSNTSLEPVTAAILHGTGWTMHASRVPVTRIALDDHANAQFGIEPMVAAARLLADASVDVIAWNGTSGSWLGLDYDIKLSAAIEKATGIPTTTSTLALMDAYRAFGVTRLGLAVPYTTDVSDRIAACYREHGVEIVTSAALGLSDNLVFGRVSVETLRQLMEQAAKGDVHAVAMVCTNLAGAPLVPELEQQLGIPIFDSISVTLWKALEMAGAPTTIPGWGLLMTAGTLRARLQEAIKDLLTATGADRTTLRIDLPAMGLQVNLTAAEAVASGVRSIRHDGSLDQHKLNTVVWLKQHRKPLVQPHFNEDPQPPQALKDVYGVRAQILGPVVRGDEVVGWISIHSLRERAWGAQEVAALAEATKRVHSALDSA
jgi:maleate isomerase